ncbi:MAG: nucleoside-triphosphatase [Promethearchaeota archaeon]
MTNKILITGPPRCGKSTLISKIIEYFHKEKDFAIHGFLTPEVRKNGNRIGFDIVDVYSEKRSHLARAGNFKTEHRLGKYSVFIQEFDKYIEESLNLEGKRVNLVVIDEIGKMELFSHKFYNFIKDLFSLEIPILATIGLKLKHPIKNYLQHLPGVQIFNLNRQNFSVIYKKTISLIV